MLTEREWEVAIRDQDRDEDTHQRMELLRGGLMTAMQCWQVEKALVEIGGGSA